MTGARRRTVRARQVRSWRGFVDSARRSGNNVPMMCRPLAVVGSMVLALSTGCGGPELSYEVVFPSLSTFLLSANAVVSIYPGAEAPDRICRNLNVNLGAGVEQVAGTGKIDVCELREQNALFENVDVGRVVFFAEVGDKFSNALMRGCTVADVFHDSDPIQITLSTLPTYPEAVDLGCESAQDKCDAKTQCDLRDVP